MGTIAEKLQYLVDSVDDIQAAIIEKGVSVADTVPLASYGAKIRAIPTGDSGSVVVGSEWFVAKSVALKTATLTTHTYTSL